MPMTIDKLIEFLQIAKTVIGDGSAEVICYDIKDPVNEFDIDIMEKSFSEHTVRWYISSTKKKYVSLRLSSIFFRKTLDRNNK